MFLYIFICQIIPKNKITGLTYVDVRQDYAKYNDGLGKKGKVVTSDEALFIMAEHKKSNSESNVKINQRKCF